MLFARTGKKTEEAEEDSPTLAEVGLTGEVGVVDVEAEAGDVAAEAEDDQLRHDCKKNRSIVYIFFRKNFIKS